MTAERLQKVLAAAGVASRRHSEEFILAGRVSVNGQTVTELGTKVDPERDQVSLDGRLLQSAVTHRYYAFNKPRGYLTTATDDRGRATIFDIFGSTGERVFTVGRLDKDSEGLLLLTNDGNLAFRMTHPRYGVEREYRVFLAGETTLESIARLKRGTIVEGERVTPVRVELEESTEDLRMWVRMVLTEGRKREVREICQAAGYTVLRLVRTRYGAIHLGGLLTGKSRALTVNEVTALRKSVGLPEPS